MTNAWLLPKVLDWPSTPQQWQGISSTEEWKRAYEIWSHADRILNETADRLFLVDAITTLKRSVNHRTHHLNELYSFDKIPISEKPRRTLEQLAYFGLVRPLMLKSLIDIRNAIEHEDAQPPNQKRCHEFLEFVWYFLRSTDVVAKNVLTEFILTESNPKIDYWLEIEMGPPDWSINIRGWMKPSMLSLNEHGEWIRLEIEKQETHEEFLKRKTGERAKQGRKPSYHPDDIFFSAVLLGGPIVCMKKLFEVYFSTTT